MSDLPESATMEKLEELFSRFEVSNCQEVDDGERCFAAQFANKEAADEAVAKIETAAEEKFGQKVKIRVENTNGGNNNRKSPKRRFNNAG